jgi:class 3 adenylate cyclase/tetratricopeptide (TPR) repeat protein
MMAYAPSTVSCPRCGSEARPGQKFCAECGFALARACPNCGTPYEGSPKFCAECGHRLPAESGTSDLPPDARATGEAAERRLVTVLFADLVGFTTLSEPHDPEEVRDLLSRYFDTARAVIDGYGGTVEKFIGDAVMAVWGAPIAREDDAERAVRAALELVERVRELSIGGEPLALRAGVLSGEAAVTIGAPNQGMVAGDLVNTASRLQSVAQAGVVLVGESTYRATSAAIAYEEAGEQTLKGKQAPVPAWRALRVVARVGGEAREEGLEPPFVGRDEELRLLKEQLHASERERRLRFVAITGQAGIGKSRLIWELEKYLDGLAGPTLYYWHQGRTPSYGEGIAFWALGEMVRRRARIAEGEGPESTRQKLREALAEFVPDAEERRWLEPALGSLIGLDKPDLTREQLFSAWRTFFERVAERGPSVLVFEDLQWADAGLLDFIEHLAEWARERPVLIVTLARPELLERRPNFGMGQRALVALHLEPLGAEAMRALLLGVVPDLDEHDLARVVERAEGVPLYAVETLRTLADQGHLARRGDSYVTVGTLPDLAVPPNLRALIAARLDALEPAQRALLQAASVLGTGFALPALAAIAGRAPETVEAELRVVALETDPRSPERGQYRFMQAMLREVAYATLGRRDRRARHLAAAAYFETLDDDELSGVRATHFLEAFKASPEGEEGAAVAAQARVALRAAADRAARLFSSAQARHYYEQAIAVTFDPADIAELELLAGQAAWNVGDSDAASRHARRSAELYDELRDEERAAEATGWLSGILVEMSRVDEGVEIAQARIARLREVGAPPSRGWMVLNNNMARGLLFRDRPEEALPAIDEALRTAERMGRRRTTINLIITKAWALWTLGSYRESLALLTGAMHLADREGHPFTRSRARFNLSSQLVIEDPHEALRLAREGMELNAQVGIQNASMAGNAAGAALVAGKLDQVLELEADVANVRTSLGQFVHAIAAVALAIRGQIDQGRQQQAEVAAIVAESDSTQDVASMRMIEAALELAAGRFTEAYRLAVDARDSYRGGESPIAATFAAHAAVLGGDVEAVHSAVEWLTDNGPPARWLDRSTRTARSGLKALEGDTAGALADYRKVINEWRSADLPYDLALALIERALLLGDVDAEAAAGRDEARQLMAAIGAEGFVERLEAGAGSPATDAVVAGARASARDTAPATS